MQMNLAPEFACACKHKERFVQITVMLGLGFLTLMLQTKNNAANTENINKPADHAPIHVLLSVIGWASLVSAITAVLSKVYAHTDFGI